MFTPGTMFAWHHELSLVGLPIPRADTEVGTP